MQAEIRGSVPKIPFAFTKTLVNRAYKEVRRQFLWSFQLFESSWTTPPIVTAGTVTATTGLATITFDATAVAAINASVIANPYSLATQRQFRIGVGGIYSIIQYDSVGGGATLDRIYGDLPTGPGQTYQLYQQLYAAPFKDFRTWLSVRNPQMFLDLILTTTRKEIDAQDPQRLWYGWPTDVVPYGIDQRGSGTANASATLGFPLFELWGQPVNPFTYQCYGVRDGVDLVAPGDTLPTPIGEDLIMPKARWYAYEWAEANKDVAPRNTGPDFRYLMGQADAEFKRVLVQHRRRDMELVNNFYIDRGIKAQAYRSLSHYNTLAGRAGPG